MQAVAKLRRSLLCYRSDAG